MVIAARTSKGKTALAIQIAYNVGFKQGLPVLIFSLEQGRIEIGNRINSNQTGIDSYKFRQPHLLKPFERDLLLQANEFFGDKLFYIDDSRSQTTSQIGPIARQFKRKHGLRLVVVDYLQLLQFPSGRWVPRHEQVAAMTRDLKGLARDLGCPVIALAQLNRNLENRQDKRPQLSDLRESGSIEQDADTVLLLHPPEDEDAKANPDLKDTLCIIIGKQRNGPTEDVTVRFDKATGRIEDFS